MQWLKPEPGAQWLPKHQQFFVPHLVVCCRQVFSNKKSVCIVSPNSNSDKETATDHPKCEKGVCKLMSDRKTSKGQSPNRGF